MGGDQGEWEETKKEKKYLEIAKADKKDSSGRSA